MFVGHYGVSFAAKRFDTSVPLWVLFLAVQLLDVLWAPFILLGIEKLRIVPGITASNPLDLYYMPYTHSLVAALLWSAIAFVGYRALSRHGGGGRAALVVAFAVFSHWLLDFIVHRPDLPIYDNTMKVGLGLWNHPVIAFALESAFLFGGMWLYLARAEARRLPFVVFGAVMLGIQAYVFFGPPPVSDMAAAWTALAAYGIFALVAARLERRPSGAEAGIPGQRAAT
ncbi:MAG TPA: hypothetical protein PKA66_09020 [Gemmatimonadales bacterium]|nr:hypothetical protein [Gemmatimonadales bacterium]